LEYEPDDEEVKLDNRHSSSPEFKKMKNCFERLGCFVKEKKNPTDSEALRFLQQG
jgi:hypothetical protein